jgi:CheY-like chemotaxis protein
MRKQTILIVDDEEILGQVLGRVLTRQGYQVVRTTNVAGGLALAQGHRPDLALLDLSMPDGDGVDLARQLQAAFPRMPLVLMTAYPLRLRERPELAERFVRVLTKPFDLTALREALDTALGQPPWVVPCAEKVAPLAATFPASKVG